MFVGRGTHLRELENNLARAQAGTTALICVEGPPGIGKTSLIHAFLSQACPTVVVEAQGNSDEADLAFGVLSQLARSASVRSGIQLAELEKAATDADPIVLGRVLLDGLAELQTLGVVVVVVEDLHWVDERSATALRFALRRLNGDRVLAPSFRSGARFGDAPTFTDLVGSRLQAGTGELALQGRDLTVGERELVGDSCQLAGKIIVACLEIGNLLGRAVQGCLELVPL